MKHFILLIIILPHISKAQPNDFGYGKLFGATVFQKDKDMRLAAFGAMGARIGRYVAAGFGAGYFKLDGAKKAIVPVGLDFNITDLGRRGFSPILMAGAYLPIYKERVETPYNIYEAKGKFMYNIGGGFAFGTSNKEKICFTVSYSQLSIKANSQVVTGSIYQPDKINLLIASVSFML